MCRSTGDRRRKPADRLSDKVSSEHGFSQVHCEKNGLVLFHDTKIDDKPIGGVSMHIETERLLLRPFSESDASDALEYLRNPVPMISHAFLMINM